MKNHLYA
nr:unnamed protein product [Nymphaea colorata]